MSSRGRSIRALAAVWLVAALAVGCAISGPAQGSPTGLLDDESFLADESFEEFPEDDPPTLAPLPPGASASPACDAAFVAWVDWWQAAMAATDPTDPDATPADDPPGDPDELERAVFERCGVVDLAAANAAHPVVLDPEESPLPYIDYDVGWFVDDTCQDDVDIVGETALCRGRPSPSP